MNEIWNALVTDSAAIVRTHFDSIVEDLLRNIVAKEWTLKILYGVQQ